MGAPCGKSALIPLIDLVVEIMSVFLWTGTAGAADVAVRQQLSSLIFVKKICEAKIRTLKYGDGELPSLPSVRLFYRASILFVVVFSRAKR